MSPLLFGLGFSIYLVFFAVAYEESPSSTQPHKENDRTENDISNENAPRDVEVALSASVNHSRKVIEATIYWKEPLKGKPSDSYYLELFPQVGESNQTCADDISDFSNHIDKDMVSFTIPQRSPQLHEILRFGCNYEGRLTVMEGGQFAYTTVFNVTIPNCVDDVCGCPSPLPMPVNVSYTFINGLDLEMNASNTLNVEWIYPDENISISSFRVFLMKKTSEQISSKEKYYSVFRSDTVKFVNGQIRYETRFNLSEEETIKTHHIGVRAYDRHLCKSHLAEKSVNIEPGQIVTDFAQNAHHHTVRVLLIGILIPVAMVTILSGTLIATRAKCKYEFQGRDFYIGKGSKDSVVTQATSLPTEHENLNLLYIPWEIDQARDCGKADNFEISYYRLKIGKEIGKGAFGRVYLAYTEGLAGSLDKKTVAVKQLKERPSDVEKEDFLAEIAMMKKVGGHPNIITMLACCTLQQPYCMVMEYVPYGDLLYYLRRLRTDYEKKTGSVMGTLNPWTCGGPDPESRREVISTDPSCMCCAEDNEMNMDLMTQTVTYVTDNESESALSGTQLIRPSTSPTSCPYSIDQSNVYLQEDIPTKPFIPNTEYCLDPQELLGFAHQIALGMAHLANKGIVHRDLAARNILIDENRTLKISDFGLSRRGIYVNRRCGRVPLRWLSIEAIRDNLYSNQSDVWAFGVVLWEICTLGGFPYSSISDKELLQHLMAGKRLERPINCAQELYNIMTSCWNSSPEKRPTFQALCTKLKTIMGDQPHNYVNFETISSNIMCAVSENSCHD